MSDPLLAFDELLVQMLSARTAVEVKHMANSSSTVSRR
ncbi:hypothetical protein imdm_1036 [gamma proteobacterium IMCC2047]|nr:hypothetical protein imdm_1036 [gamma proteobacterium IMCC2047]